MVHPVVVACQVLRVDQEEVVDLVAHQSWVLLEDLVVGEAVDRHQVGEVNQEQAVQEVVDQGEEDPSAIRDQVEVEDRKELVVLVDQAVREEVQAVLYLEPIQLLSF